MCVLKRSDTYLFHSKSLLFFNVYFVLGNLVRLNYKCFFQPLWQQCNVCRFDHWELFYHVWRHFVFLLLLLEVKSQVDFKKIRFDNFTYFWVFFVNFFGI